VDPCRENRDYRQMFGQRLGKLAVRENEQNEHAAKMAPAYPPIYNAVDARDAAEHEAAKKKRAERAAATRTANAQRKAERIAAKDRRIAELEAQLASKPKLNLVK
jgi:hypothetical protein